VHDITNGAGGLCNLLVDFLIGVHRRSSAAHNLSGEHPEGQEQKFSEPPMNADERR
jgi:hypothetical protein